MSTPPQGEQPAAPEQPAIPLPPPEAIDYARQLAVTLGETEEKPIIQIARSVDTLGQEKAKTLADEALRVYAGDGILTKDKTTGEMRKRSPGGTFFALVRKEVGEKDWRKKIKPIFKQKKGESVNLTEELAKVMAAAALSSWKAGNSTSSKLILIGQTGSVQKQPTFVAVTVKANEPPQLPKGLPPLKKSEARYLVLIATKQWEKVEAALSRNKEDKLYAEGYSTMQPGFSGIVVLATTVNTIGLMRASRK